MCSLEHHLFCESGLDAILYMSLYKALSNEQLSGLMLINIPNKTTFYEQAVTQDSVSIADAKDFRHFVRDIDEGDSFILEPLHDGEQLLDLLVVQGGCGLVHDDELTGKQQRPGNFNHLLLSGIKFGNDCMGIDAAVHGIEHLLGLLHLPLLINHPPLLGELLTKEHILEDRQVIAQIQLLMDEANLQLSSFFRRHALDDVPIDLNRSCIRTKRSGQDVHQCRFSRPVLTKQAMDLLAAHREGDILQGLYRSKRL